MTSRRRTALSKMHCLPARQATPVFGESSARVTRGSERKVQDKCAGSDASPRSPPLRSLASAVKHKEVFKERVVVDISHKRGMSTAAKRATLIKAKYKFKVKLGPRALRGRPVMRSRRSPVKRKKSPHAKGNLLKKEPEVFYCGQCAVKFNDKFEIVSHLVRSHKANRVVGKLRTKMYGAPPMLKARFGRLLQSVSKRLDILCKKGGIRGYVALTTPANLVEEFGEMCWIGDSYLDAKIKLEQYKQAIKSELD